MNFSKAMIDLISEARRRAPSEDKPSIKLANPEVLNELSKIFQNSHDAVLKAIIKEIFALAGDPWPKKLLTQKTIKDEDTKYATRVYRGQTQLVEIDKKGSQETKKPTNKSSQRIYRGRVVA